MVISLKKAESCYRSKTPKHIRSNDKAKWQLHIDNVRTHTYQVTTTFLSAEMDFSVMAHPPFSPDMALSDFSLYSVFKADLTAHRAGI